jgi:hypothetical protein
MSIYLISVASVLWVILFTFRLLTGPRLKILPPRLRSLVYASWPLFVLGAYELSIPYAGMSLGMVIGSLLFALTFSVFIDVLLRSYI